MENVFVCARRASMLGCSHHNILFFCSPYAFQSSSLASAVAAAAALRRSLLRMIPNFILPHHARTYDVRPQYILRTASPRKTASKPNFCFVQKAFFSPPSSPLLLLYWSLSLLSLTCILCERNVYYGFWILGTWICIYNINGMGIAHINEPRNILPCATHLAWWSIIFLNVSFRQCEMLNTQRRNGRSKCARARERACGVRELSAHRFSNPGWQSS